MTAEERNELAQTAWQTCFGKLPPDMQEVVALARGDPQPHPTIKNVARLRILPRRKLPPTFWSSASCFFEITVGTMGGLVRQGRAGRFEPTLRRAIAHAAWCSSDPVCIESRGQGTDNANLAACHSCTLLPETSCETGNRLLDRALLVGTPTDPTFGFFKNLLEATT